MLNHNVNLKTLALSTCPLFLRRYWEQIEASPLGFRLAKGAFWSLAGAIISRGLALLSFILVARFLGKEGFGELSIIQSTVGMFGVFAGCGLGLTATKHIAEFRSQDPERAGRILALSGMTALIGGGLMAMILFGMAPWLAAHVLAAPHLADTLRIGAILLWIMALNGAQLGALSGFEAFKITAHVNFWSGLFSFPVCVAGAYWGGLVGAVWGLVLSQAVNWGLTHLAIRVEARRYSVPLRLAGCTKEWRILWSFSVPSLLGHVVTSPATWVCNAMLVNQPGGYVGMGVYNAVMMIKHAPELVSNLLMTPLLPVLSEQYGRKEFAACRRVLTMAFALSMSILVPVALILTAVPSLTFLPYGKDFTGSFAIVQWLMLHTVLVGLFQPFKDILASMNKMWLGCAYNMAWGIAFVSFAYFLVPAYFNSGLAAAYGIAYISITLLCAGYIYFKEKPLFQGIHVWFHLSFAMLLFLVCVSVSYAFEVYIAAAAGILAVCLYYYVFVSVFGHRRLV